MRKFGLLFACVLLACSDDRAAGGEDSTTGVMLPDTETETGGPTCIEEECNAECSMQIDVCDHAMFGECRSEGCVCESGPCEPCESDADCEDPWDGCDPVLGCIGCNVAPTIAWDPGLQCILDLEGINMPLIPAYIRFAIDGEELEFTDSCILLPTAIRWQESTWTQYELCPDACAAFEAAGELSVLISCPPK